MKRFPIQFLQSLLIFSAILVWGCSPNTTLSTNPCVGPGNDCANGLRSVYYEITVTPPLPTTGPPSPFGYISFLFGGPYSGAGYQWNSSANSYSLSTVTTNCFGLDPNFQHQITASIQYIHPYDTLGLGNFTPWIGQCHSVDVKAYALDGSLLGSWFAPSIGAFVVGNNAGIYDWNFCGGSGLGPVNFGTLILPPCP